jgi:hypothetical protein
MSQQLAEPVVWLSKAASRLQRRRRRKGTVKERNRACEELIDIARAAIDDCPVETSQNRDAQHCSIDVKTSAPRGLEKLLWNAKAIDPGEQNACLLSFIL